jgi:hypothetical protein
MPLLPGVLPSRCTRSRAYSPGNFMLENLKKLFLKVFAKFLFMCSRCLSKHFLVSPGHLDEQLADLHNFCCQGHTVIGTDKTFNLCDMFVTVTCYKQLSVNRQRTDEHPIFMGPIYLHDKSDFESYCHFFYHLKMKLCSFLYNYVYNNEIVIC